MEEEPTPGEPGVLSYDISTTPGGFSLSIYPGQPTDISACDAPFVLGVARSLMGSSKK